MSAWLKRALLCALFTGGMLVVGAGSASAEGLPIDPGGLIEQVQAATNSNTTDQSSDANAETTQVNVNAPISILSFGSNNGDVDQSNDANTSATAGNSNGTTQGIGQGQAATSGSGSPCDPCGDPGGGDISQSQDGSNENSTEQEANADASTSQLNLNAPISILSFGSNNGDVDQSNDAHTGAVAGNSNETTQGIVQGQWAESDGASGHGCGCEDGGDIWQSQNGSNENSTSQSSNAEATTEQRNLNVPFSFLGFGSGGGDVSQSNDATTRAWAENANSTFQEVVQDQSATTGPGDACGSGCHATSGGHISQSQDGQNSNRTGQEANATSGTSQENLNSPVSVLGGFGCGGCGGPSVDHGCGCQPPKDDHSCGCESSGGDVTQGNDAHTTAVSSNTNATHQGIEQSQDATSTGDGGGCCPSAHAKSCGCEDGGSGIDQSQNGSNANGTRQAADADASTEQSNENSPFSYVGLGSAGGDVEQANDATTRAWSLNDNGTAQWIGQAQSAATGGGDA